MYSCQICFWAWYNGRVPKGWYIWVTMHHFSDYIMIHEVKTCILNIACVWGCVLSKAIENSTAPLHCMVSWALFVNGQILFHENCTNHMPYVRHRFQTPKSVITNWVFFLRSLLMGLMHLFILSKLGTLFPPQCIPHARTVLFGRQSCLCPPSQRMRGGWYTTTTCIPYFCIECVVAWKQSLSIGEHQNAYL